ncbi:HAD family hydrolase [Solirubrobacter soli]|uniref:HAD family hydrolase n=1 Tax=Solirubrobacter soli TaxID=363832 RepID=UPI000419102B|nr:HAD family hydrolase [Solirubrobacter soli]
MTRALLFDLDDTLMVEEPAAVAAFDATARAAAAAARHDVDAAALALAARARARELWYAAPTHPFCRRVGISSWEGLWCRFEGEAPDVRALRTWAPTYRREAWRLALADQGIDDSSLAAELGDRFITERRARHQVFDDVTPTLDDLRESYALALVTNGASCLQRDKLAASGLSHYFDAVVVSGDLGVAKPDAAVFTHARTRLNATSGATTMIGDSLTRDVDGARAAGLNAIWLNRSNRTTDRSDVVVEISSLTALGSVLSDQP